nr:unnamed protein product [Digitaria exilis]
MPEDKEYAPVPLGQAAAEAAAAPNPEDPVKSPPRPSSPATSTRKALLPYPRLDLGSGRVSAAAAVLSSTAVSPFSSSAYLVRVPAAMCADLT